MSDKRSVSTDALETLGTIIDERAARDAIHVAVYPVKAAETLYPGQHVSRCGFHDPPVDRVGIVDPFLTTPVFEGQWFWMLLYPRTITSLRHVWSHPDFGDQEVPAAGRPDKAASEAWLRDFCAHADCPDYDTVMEAAINHPDSWDDDYLHFEGRDAHGDIPPEFWDHVEIVTGIKITKRASHFSCSC